MKNFTIEKLEEEMNMVDWNSIMEKIETHEELDEKVEKLETRIREVMEKVAPVKVINNDPDFLGDWMNDDLKGRKANRNKKRLELLIKGKSATDKEWADWRKQRNKIGADIEKAKKMALKKKADNELENSSNMHNTRLENRGSPGNVAI